MSSRARYSTVQPGVSRQSVAATPTSSRNAIANKLELPPYQKPSHPLNQRAQDQLKTIYSERTSSALRGHQKRAAEYITDSAGALYDQLREREERVARRRKKWERGIRTEEREEEEQKLEDLKETVEKLTVRLEESMRDVIDNGEAAQRISESLRWVRENAPRQLHQEYTTQVTQRQSQRQSQHRNRRPGEQDNDEHVEDEESGSSPGPTPLFQERIALTGPSEMFGEQLESKKNEYLSYSYTARYSKNNSYIGFKSIVHDAKYGDSGLQLPHPDTWFTETGSPAPGVTATQEGSEADDDVVIDRATISTRCPITLQRFRDPYTSTKCPHTYEKNAILDMIRHANRHVRAIECPVSGCNQMLTANDLHQDLVVIRKIKRMQLLEEQAAEDSDPEEEDVVVPKREKTVDDNGGFAIPARVKRETNSDVHATQEPPPQSQVIDLGDPSDEDD